MPAHAGSKKTVLMPVRKCFSLKTQSKDSCSQALIYYSLPMCAGLWQPEPHF